MTQIDSSAQLAADLGGWLHARGLTTPLQLFSTDHVHSGIAQLRTSLRARVSFAYKANTHPLMLAAVRDRVDEYNTTNLAHVRQLVDAGIDPAHISYVNPVFTDTVLGKVLECGVTQFVIDDERGLRALLAQASAPSITLRLRPHQDGASPRSMVRFGNDAEGLRPLARAAVDAGACYAGLSFFVGTHGDTLDAGLPYKRAIAEAAALSVDLARDGIATPSLNIGGGFPGARRPMYERNPEFFAHVRCWLDEAFGSAVSIVCEPGRFLAEPSMTTITKVIADRVVSGRRSTHVDISAYSGLFETTFISEGGNDLQVVALVGDDAGEWSRTQLLGPIMDSFDVLKRDAELPPLRPGDLLVLPDTGAYSYGYYSACEGSEPPSITAAPEWLDRALRNASPGTTAGVGDD